MSKLLQLEGGRYEDKLNSCKPHPQNPIQCVYSDLEHFIRQQSLARDMDVRVETCASYAPQQVLNLLNS